MNKNLSTAVRFTVVVRTGRKVEERATRCTNQETGHRVARDIARDATRACVVELVSPQGEVVERFTVKVSKGEVTNRLEVLNGASVQAVRRAERAATKGAVKTAA